MKKIKTEIDKVINQMTKEPPKLVPHEEFLAILQAGVIRVIQDPSATPKDLTDAVNAGSKLSTTQHKVVSGEDDGFFGK